MLSPFRSSWGGGDLKRPLVWCAAQSSAYTQAVWMRQDPPFSFGNRLLAASLCCLSLLGYFQQPQGEMVTDACTLPSSEACMWSRVGRWCALHNIWLSPWRQWFCGSRHLNLITSERDFQESSHPPRLNPMCLRFRKLTYLNFSFNAFIHFIPSAHYYSELL